MDRALGLYDGPRVSSNHEIFSKIEKEIRNFMSKYGRKVQKKRLIQKTDLKFMTKPNPFKFGAKTGMKRLEVSRPNILGGKPGGLIKRSVRGRSGGANSLISLKRKKELRKKMTKNK